MTTKIYFSGSVRSIWLHIWNSYELIEKYFEFIFSVLIKANLFLSLFFQYLNAKEALSAYDWELWARWIMWLTWLRQNELFISIKWLFEEEFKLISAVILFLNLLEHILCYQENF